MYVLRREIKTGRVSFGLCLHCFGKKKMHMHVEAVKYEFYNFGYSASGSDTLKFAFETGIAHYEVDW